LPTDRLADAATAKRRKDAASSDAAGEYLRLAYVH